MVSRKKELLCNRVNLAASYLFELPLLVMFCRSMTLYFETLKDREATVCFLQ